MKKRVLSMAMATVMAASLTACGSGSTATTAAPTETNADTSAAASEAASEAAGSSDADVQKIIDRGVLKVGCKSDVPNFSLQNTATGEYEGFEDDLAYEIAGDIFGCSADEAKEKKLVEFQGVTATFLSEKPLCRSETIRLLDYGELQGSLSYARFQWHLV